MEVYLNEIQGTADAINTMFFSKRTWTREKELEIRRICKLVLDENGFVKPLSEQSANLEEFEKFNSWMGKATKWGTKHITMLRFMDFSITVEGLHRAGQDDWDAHAQRYNNRIIRSSTRLATFEGDEISEWYKGKILPMDMVLALEHTNMPEEIEYNNSIYVRSTNGYVREDLKDDKDAKRGLYMECIPSNFTFKVNLTEWAHVFKERNNESGANPEVKRCCEKIADQLVKANPFLTRELFNDIKN